MKQIHLNVEPKCDHSKSRIIFALKNNYYVNTLVYYQEFRFKKNTDAVREVKVKLKKNNDIALKKLFDFHERVTHIVE